MKELTTELTTLRTRLNEIIAEGERATPVPWTWDDDPSNTGIEFREQHAPWLCSSEREVIRGNIFCSAEDAAFICTARNATTALARGWLLALDAFELAKNSGCECVSCRSVAEDLEEHASYLIDLARKEGVL